MYTAQLWYTRVTRHIEKSQITRYRIGFGAFKISEIRATSTFTCKTLQGRRGVGRGLAVARIRNEAGSYFQQECCLDYAEYKGIVRLAKEEKKKKKKIRKEFRRNFSRETLTSPTLILTAGEFFNGKEGRIGEGMNFARVHVQVTSFAPRIVEVAWIKDENRGPKLRNTILGRFYLLSEKYARIRLGK